MKVLWLVLFSALHFGASLALDLHLEGADAGFFFQQSLGSSQQPLLKFPAHSYSSNASSSADPPPLLRERLAVLGPSAQPGRILVTYGPFEAKQSLPTKYLTLPLENATEGGEQATLMDVTAHVVNTELRRESPVLRVLFHSGRHFHSPGHIVEDDPDRGAANPSAAAAEEWEDEPNGRLMETCIALRVHNPNGGAPLTGTCAPQGLDGVCLAYLTLPFDWWASSPISPTFPSLNAGILGLQQHPTVTAKPSKAVRNVVELSYAVYETKAGQCGHSDPSTSNVGRVGHQKSQQQQRASSSSANSFPPPSAVLIQPSRPIGSVRLLPNVYAPRDLLVHEEVISLSPTLRFIASAAPLYPHSYFYVTVLLDSTTAKEEPYAVIVRAKVKNGLKIISTQTTNPAWSLSFDVNGKHIAAAVSAVRNFSVSTQPHQPSQELFTWLLAVNVDHHRDSSELGDGVRALWSWTIRTHSASPPLPSSISGHHHHTNNKEGQLDEVKGKLTSRFEVLKDEVQSVFPIIKRRDLVNTAILTSRQVSEPLRVFMVTQAGKVADVTLQATCSSADESVLKVSSSCTSVYLDGSEVRGSTNATLVARYGNVESTSSLTVWVPEMPLDIQLDDVKLNQISGWKVMASAANGGSANQCRLRYQQSSFEVFARFYAEDHDSGRVSYLISRKTYLLITDLVRKVMRVADPRVASLKMTSGFIEGLKPGKTEVQVLSPMSGHVIAARELRVLADKVDVSSLSVRLIAGLSLSLSPDPDLDSCFVAQVDASDRLHSRYQEAILDLTVHFSDGSASPLRLTDRSHYNLVVESHNTSILALTSPARANIPRVLALGEGRATLSVTFSSACTTSQTVGGGDGIGDASHHRQVPAHPLATTMAVIQLALTGHPATSVQNDARTESSGQLYTLPQGGHGNGNQIIGDSRRNGGGGGGGGKMASASAAAAAAGRLAQPNQGQLTFSKPGSIEFGVNENQLSLKDDSNAVMMSNAGREMQSHQHPAYPSHYPGGFGSFSSSSFQHMGPLEIGMYVLLAIFCAAIVVFVGTCIVYASRARKGLIPTDDSDQHIDRQPPTIDPWPSLWNRLKKMNPKGGGGGSDEQRGRGIAGEENEDEEEGTDKGWIWLGRSTLDPEVPRRQTRPLSATGAARPASTTNAADVSANRLSGISYTGSEVSVRIVGRPSGQDGGRLSYKAQLCFEPLKDAADDDDDIDHDAQHPNSWPGSVDSKTFTKANNSSQQQQELLHHHPGALRIITNQLAAAEEPLLLSDVVRRPSNNRRAARRASEQDTRRYARSWLMAGEAVPRDFNSNPSIIMDSSDAEEEEEEEIQDLGCHVPNAFPNAKKNLKLDLSSIDNKKTDSEYNVATFLRHGSPDIKQANIIENPRFSPTALATTTTTSVEVENDAEHSAVGGESVESHPSAASALDVDYDRIISYLGILKETST